jgi:Ca-activated chloride channel family protein
VEKQRAREIYESYKRRNRDPGLLEQVDFKTFEMRIFPIAAGAEQRVRITYYQELDHDHDQATYVYPLATATHPGIEARTRRRFAFSLDVTSPVPITALTSPSHGGDLVVVPHDESYVQASLEVTEGNLQRDVVIELQLERPRTGVDLVTSRRNREDGYFCLTLTTGQDLEEMKEGADYVLVLDISGSMSDDGKLGRSTGAIEAFIDVLGADDRFELITFNAMPGGLFQKLAPVTDATRRQARGYLAQQTPRGGTQLGPALGLAYRYHDPDRTLNVVVLSDGMTETAGRAELQRLIRERPSGARTFCIGIGNEIDRPLLEEVARSAGGLAAFLSTEGTSARQAQSFRRKLMHPVATDVQIAFAGGDVYDVEPPEMPNLYHGAPVRAYGRYRKPGPVTVTVRANLRGRVFEESCTLELPREEVANPEIERMWAWHRMNRLQEELDRVGADPARRQEIVRLGEAYSIAGEHTSFIVLENDAEYRRWKIQRRNLLRLEGDRTQLVEVRQHLQELRDRSLARLGPAPDEEPTPAVASTSSRQVRPSTPTRQRRSPHRHGPSFGGGALDPITALVLLCAGGFACLTRRRRSAPGHSQP